MLKNSIESVVNDCIQRIRSRFGGRVPELECAVERAVRVEVTRDQPALDQICNSIVESLALQHAYPREFVVYRDEIRTDDEAVFVRKVLFHSLSLDEAVEFKYRHLSEAEQETAEIEWQPPLSEVIAH